MVTGSFDKSGFPCIDIGVSGPLANITQFQAVTDTGFTGFLSIPILKAFPIGLLLHGTMSLVLADGSAHYTLTCLRMAHLGDEKEIGIIIVEPESIGVLVGMEFLRKFKKKLVVDPFKGTVELHEAEEPEEPSSEPAPAPQNT